jgi:hypothetical protein
MMMPMAMAMRWLGFIGQSYKMDGSSCCPPSAQGIGDTRLFGNAARSPTHTRAHSTPLCLGISIAMAGQTEHAQARGCPRQPPLRPMQLCRWRPSAGSWACKASCNCAGIMRAANPAIRPCAPAWSLPHLIAAPNTQQGLMGACLSMRDLQH